VQGNSLVLTEFDVVVGRSQKSELKEWPSTPCMICSSTFWFRGSVLLLLVMLVAQQFPPPWLELPGTRAASKSGPADVYQIGSSCEPRARVAVQDRKRREGAMSWDLIGEV
jgi:hypothetical protein